MATYFNNESFFIRSPNSISVAVVPQRDIIYFASDLFLGLWRSIFSLAIYFRGRNALIRCDKSPCGRPALHTFTYTLSQMSHSPHTCTIYKQTHTPHTHTPRTHTNTYHTHTTCTDKYTYTHFHTHSIYKHTQKLIHTHHIHLHPTQTPYTHKHTRIHRHTHTHTMLHIFLFMEFGVHQKVFRGHGGRCR